MEIFWLKNRRFRNIVKEATGKGSKSGNMKSKENRCKAYFSDGFLTDSIKHRVYEVFECVFSGKLYGVGIGTIIAMIAVGRIIATFNHFTKQKLMQMTGVEE